MGAYEGIMHAYENALVEEGSRDELVRHFLLARQELAEAEASAKSYMEALARIELGEMYDADGTIRDMTADDAYEIASAAIFPPQTDSE